LVILSIPITKFFKQNERGKEREHETWESYNKTMGLRRCGLAFIEINVQIL
jgi:hypothetical protein